MAAHQSYELLQRGTDYRETDEHTSFRAETPLATEKTLPHSNTTTAFEVDPDVVEKPDVALERRILPLLLSFLIHIVPAVSTVAIAQLSFFNVYWFDSDDANPDRVPWKGITVSLNELLNSLQFVAKIHEILLVGSLAAMVMHRVRIRLLGKHGLPFGMLVGGYQVGAPEYLLSGAFRSGFNKRFWPLSLLIFVFTVLANTLGPASAIAMVPNLDWYSMKNPFGSENLTVTFDLAKDEWWPLQLTKNQTITFDTVGDQRPETVCFSTDAYDTTQCPASGFIDLVEWTGSNAVKAIEANVTTNDDMSPVQRRLKSRLTKSEGTTPGVAITTSMSQSIMSVMGTFWEEVQSRKYPVNDVIRPQLGLPNKQTSFQPLVQVHCLPKSLDDIHKLEKGATVVQNSELNTFSVNNASQLAIPDWIYEYQFIAPNATFEAGGEFIPAVQDSVNITWLGSPNQDGYNLSMAAIVMTPMILGDIADSVNSTQTALFHFCSVDARWIASQPTYDPSQHLVLAHNVTDPLIFQKPKSHNEGQYGADKAKWGVSPALQISMDWANALTIPAQQLNVTAPATHWLFAEYVVPIFNVTGINVTENTDLKTLPANFIFNPGDNGVADPKELSLVNQDDIDQYAKSVSETVATVLGLQITDGLARVRVSEAQRGAIVTKHINATHVNLAILNGAVAGFGVNAVNVSIAELQQATLTEYTFNVQRYGYGYGFTTATVYFGIAVLLAHSVLTVIYIVYALWDYFFVSHWTSSAWGDIGDFAALLINSRPTVELQNTCAGIDSKYTWQKRLRIRETGDGHLGVVVGDEGFMTSRPVRVGVSYGTLDVKDMKEGGSGLRKRRGSV